MPELLQTPQYINGQTHPNKAVEMILIDRSSVPKLIGQQCDRFAGELRIVRRSDELGTIVAKLLPELVGIYSLSLEPSDLPTS